MLKFLASLAVALVPVTAAPAAEPAYKTAERDGYRFEYITEMTPSGLVRIHGHILEGSRFEFVIRKNGRVTGFVGKKTVTFSVGRRKRNSLVAALAKQSETPAVPPSASGAAQ